MKRHILIIALVASLFCGCKKQWDSDWFNRFSPEYVDMGLEGGEISVTAHCEIVYMGIYVVDDQGERNKVYTNDYLLPDTSNYPYCIKTKLCEIEHVSAKKMNISIFPTEQRHALFIALGGIDEKGVTHRTPGNGIWIYQGYSSRPIYH